MNRFESVADETWFEVPCSSLIVIPATKARNFRVVIDRVCTLGVTKGTSGQRIHVRVQQGATGYAVTLDGSIGVSTDFGVSATANAISRIDLQYDDAAKTWEHVAAAPSSTTGAYPAGGSSTGRLLAATIKDSGVSFTTNASTTLLIVRMVGGGGGGGGASSVAVSAAAGGGGQGGGWMERQFVVTGSTVYAYTVGAAGTAGANTGGNGGNGGATTFVHSATTYTATGGAGGEGSVAGTALAVVRGGQTGTSNTSTGTPLVNSGDAGQPGGFGIVLSGLLAASGMGGTTPYGRGGWPMAGGGDGGTNGKTGTGYGSGGGGGCTTNGSSAALGGTGTQGMLIFMEYS